MTELQKAEKALDNTTNLNKKSFYEGYIKGLKFQDNQGFKKQKDGTVTSASFISSTDNLPPAPKSSDPCTMDELKESITTQLCYLADFDTDEESLNAAEGHAEIIMAKIKVFIKNQNA